MELIVLFCHRVFTTNTTMIGNFETSPYVGINRNKIYLLQDRPSVGEYSVVLRDVEFRFMPLYLKLCGHRLHFKIEIDNYWIEDVMDADDMPTSPLCTSWRTIGDLFTGRRRAYATGWFWIKKTTEYEIAMTHYTIIKER